MALGDQNKKQNYENSYFSRTKFSNYEDKKTLSFSFWKGNLKVSINEIKESYSGIEYEELAYIHLSPNKAQILKSQLIDFINLEDSATTSLFVGVDTGISDTKNFIAIGNTTDSSEKDIQRVLCIGKVSPDGKVLEKTDFKFNHNYHFGIEWTNVQNMDCETKFKNNVELELFIILLEEYIKSMTGAMAYSVMDMGRFDYSRINTKIELVMNALGVEVKSNKQQNNSSNSYFNKNGLGAASPENTNRARSERTTIEDLA